MLAGPLGGWMCINISSVDFDVSINDVTCEAIENKVGFRLAFYWLTESP